MNMKQHWQAMANQEQERINFYRSRAAAERLEGRSGDAWERLARQAEQYRHHWRALADRS